MRQSYRTPLLASLLVLICAVVLWNAYEWFQGRYLRAFSEHTAMFSGDPLQLPAELAGPGRSAWCISGTRPAPAMSVTSSTWPS
ncbi:hypothetical protein PBOI14_73700 [Pseudomonas sp. Boi14]|nr:hypothetical protein PBOI14_73700 [Pseudomonas sp. Boi14]